MIRTSLAGLTAFALALPALAPTQARAHKVTDVLDAADGDNLFDFVGEVTYKRTLRRSKITRDFNCDPNRGMEGDSCPGATAAGTLLNVKELRYQRVRHEVTPKFRFGLWHDLELAVTMPIVIDDTQNIRFAGNGGASDGVVIDGSLSTIAPDDGPKLFPVPVPGLPTRSGFGDMEFMIRFAPISQQRDDQRGDWVLELGYRAPTGEIMKFGNTGVGRGVHELVIGTSLSRRFTYVDPYVRVEAALPFAAADSLFKDYGFAQEHVAPGARGVFDFGAEFIPYEDTKKKMKFFVSLGLGATYQAEGRDYSDLFDALAIGSKMCAPSNPSSPAPGNCAVFNPDSNSSVRNQAIDGITTVEDFVQLRGHLGLGAQLGPYFRLGLDLTLAHDTEHYLSNADIGKVIPSQLDDGPGRVEPRSDVARYNPNEHNPTYSPAIDEPGRRLRVEETTIFGMAISAAVTF